jgi:ABC-type xylose transport system permease subunit
MKQETQDIAMEVLKAAPAVTITGLTLNEYVAIATICFIVLQALYLVRKWIREETEWGRQLKRWALEKFTKPGDLQ